MSPLIRYMTLARAQTAWHWGIGMVGLMGMEIIGLIDTALSWFKSYLSNRKQLINLKGFNTTTVAVTHGVPQGSVLDPLLFTIYMLPLGQIICNHGLNFHCYADDTLQSAPTN